MKNGKNYVMKFYIAKVERPCNYMQNGQRTKMNTYNIELRSVKNANSDSDMNVCALMHIGQ